MPRFASSQSVDLELPGSLAAVQSYLDDPRRIVYALFDAERVDELADSVFRLHMQTLRFFTLKVTPTVDLRVWTDDDHVLHIKALDCQLSGMDAVNQQFTLTLSGHLRPVAVPQDQTDVSAVVTRAVGQADLDVQVDLPSPFAIMSNTLIRKTGNKLLNGVLATIKRRLATQLKIDCQQWAATYVDEVAAQSG